MRACRVQGRAAARSPSEHQLNPTGLRNRDDRNGISALACQMQRSPRAVTRWQPIRCRSSSAAGPGEDLDSVCMPTEDGVDERRNTLRVAGCWIGPRRQKAGQLVAVASGGAPHKWEEAATVGPVKVRVGGGNFERRNLSSGGGEDFIRLKPRAQWTQQSQ